MKRELSMVKEIMNGSEPFHTEVLLFFVVHDEDDKNYASEVEKTSQREVFRGTPLASTISLHSYVVSPGLRYFFCHS